jgi:glucokinase
MTIILGGDIGGTKTILRLVDCQNSPDSTQPLLTTLDEEIYPSKQYPDLVPIVQQFLARQATIPLVEKACFGIAGPVINNSSELTNLSWSLTGDRLGHELSIERVKLINDFAAIGYGVLGLAPEDLHTLQAVPAVPDAPIAVIGAGTGLGEGFVIPVSKGKYRVFGSEGSHADFAPRSSLEYQLLNYLLELYNIDRISVERVVSGQGITSIYRFLHDSNYSESSPAMAEIYRTWLEEMGKPNKTVDLAAKISTFAEEDSDYLCYQTMKIFVEAYGAEAGNLALKLLPYGGLYIAGGIAAKNLSLLTQGSFMKAFRGKGRMTELLSNIPVHIVLNPKVGLIGAVFCASQL